MHTLNGSSQQQQQQSSNNGATGDGSGNNNNSDVETLHPLSNSFNNNSHNHHSNSNTLNYTNLKSSLNSNGHQSHYLNNNNNHNQNQQELQIPMPSFTSGQRDILRLIGQHLRSLGLSKTTESLINESGCMLEHPTATNFCNLVMNGEWDKAERSLNDLKSLMDLNTDITIFDIRQKYLECLEDGKVLEALKCLRDELAPLKYNTDRLHELSSFLMCAGTDDLKKLSNWDGKTDSSRQKLMDKLQAFLPANIMLPPRRLENLLTQAIELQCERCPFHNTNEKACLDTWCLFKDHACTRDHFPTTNIQILTDHCDEIWYCKFSNDGTKLATGSKDGTLIIWDVNPNTLKVTLNKTYDEHTCGVSYVEWSPDDRYIIVCGADECNELWIWDVEQKVIKKRLNNSHDDSLIAAAWLPDGQHFVCGGLKGQFYYCDIECNVKDTWEGVRVRSLQCLPDGVVLAADSLKRIRRYNFRDISDSNLIQEDFNIMSFTLNKQSNLALICVAAQGMHLWDLKDRVLVRRYQGALQNHYLGWSTFGGINESYVASGSEDNKVFIWHVKKEQPICILEGHTRSVNCVSWNPVYHGQMASVSDDGTVRIWAPSQYATDASVSNNNSTVVNNNLTNDNNNNNIAINTISTLNNENNTTGATATSNTHRSDRSTPV